MYKFNMKLLYKEEKLSCTKTEMLNLTFTLPLAKLNVASIKWFGFFR